MGNKPPLCIKQHSTHVNGIGTCSIYTVPVYMANTARGTKKEKKKKKKIILSRHAATIARLMDQLLLCVNTAAMFAIPYCAILVLNSL